MPLTLTRYERRSDQQLNELISCYQQVFAEPPWCEWKRCKSCTRKWGIHQQAEVLAMPTCTCGQRIEEYWPYESVREEILDVMNRPTATCWLAVDEERVVGFCWGYALAVDQLDDQLKLSGVSLAFTEKFGPDVRYCAYQNELGLISAYRGKGIAGQLVRHRMNDFIQANLTIGVVRTKTLPPTVTYLWYLDRGYEVIANYNDSDGRVVMARSLHGRRL